MYLGDQTKKNEMGEARNNFEDSRSVYRVLVGKPEGTIPFGRPRHRWDDNIRMDHQEIR